MQSSQQPVIIKEGRLTPRTPARDARGGRSGEHAAAHLDRHHGGRAEAVLVERAQALLLADLRCPPTTHRLAGQLGVGEKRLVATFKAVLGRSISEVLRQARLDAARRAIETRDAPLKQIAWELGYGDVTNFIHAFRNRFGAPPRRFQKGAARPPLRLAA